MSTPISAAGAERALPAPPRNPAPQAPTRAFSEVLEAPDADGLGARVLDAAREMARGQRRLDVSIRRASRGGDLAPTQLLALQAGVYRTTQELELASKLVDKATSAVKQTLQSQR